MGFINMVKETLSNKKNIDKNISESLKKQEIYIKEASNALRDPDKIRVAKIGQSITSASAGEFEDNPVDLDEMQRAYYTDSYIRRAIDKHAGLMFKNGWDFNGPNEETTEYVGTRFKIFEETTGKSFGELISQAAFDFVLYGNAFLVKARADNKIYSQYDGMDLVGYTDKKPVAGYFLLPPTSIRVARDEKGEILNYEQDTGSGEVITIDKKDMVHICYRKPTGRAYGIPYAYNVLDDVQILRQLEENVARLVYRNLFPVYQYQVGIDKPGFEATQEEIDNLKEEIASMPMDGALVVPERHNIKVIGAEGEAINAEPYLKYYRQRVFTGLGVSDSVMGIGDSSNKSTSDNQESDLFDTVKEFQRIFSEQIQNLIVNELLFEKEFDPIMNVEDEVTFFFNEIELGAKTKIQNHAIQKFMQNAISHDEMRAEIGLDPIVDESKLYINMITIPTIKASASDDGTTASETDVDSQQQAASNQSKNNTDPKNQHSEESSKHLNVSESKDEKILTKDKELVKLNKELRSKVIPLENDVNKIWSGLVKNVVEMTTENKPVEDIKLFATELVRKSYKSKNDYYIKKSMTEGYKEASNSKIPQYLIERSLRQSNNKIDSVINDINRELENSSKLEDLSKRISNTIGLLNSTKNRFMSISKTNFYESYNKGYANGCKNEGVEYLIVESSKESCKECSDLNGQKISLTDDEFEKSIPPYHLNCSCTFIKNTEEDEQLE